MQDFHYLMVWQKAHQLTLLVYEITRRFPDDERYGLSSQLRRASVGANLAEGCGRSGDLDFARFARIALGSTSEVEYHLLLARDLGYIPATEHQGLDHRTNEIKRMLVSLLRQLRKSERK